MLVSLSNVQINSMSIRYIFVLGVFTMLGCSDSDITSANDIVFPATNVSFKAHVEPLFSFSCNITGCHDVARSSNKYVDLTSWTGTRAINVVNQPGDTNCGLIQVVFERAQHIQLNLTNNHRQGLKQWVIEGAKDN
jgi:hypothetical protein